MRIGQEAVVAGPRDESGSAVAAAVEVGTRTQPGPWSLAALEPSEDGGEQAAFAQLRALVESFVGYRERLEVGADEESLDGALLLEIVGSYEELLAEALRLSAYGSLRFAADTQDEEALAYQNRTRSLLTEMQNQTLFFSLWWQGLDDESAAALLQQAKERPEGSDDRIFFLEDLRRQAPYRLSEEVERVVNLKDADGISGLLTVYSMITNAFEFQPEIDGVDGPVSRDQLMSHAFSPDAAVRTAAYQELYRVYDGQAKVLSQIYVHRVRDWHAEQVQLRGHRSPIAVRNQANDVPDGAVEALLEAARASAPIFQRYFRRKASWLGVEKLRRYDLYAPLAGSSSTVEYGDAVRLVLETFERFHPEIGAAAASVFDAGHVDAPARRGKKGGAFCATVTPDLVPWVLVNYSGRLRDVATLAHELGHAVHSVLASRHSVLTQHPTLPLAETASVFGEILITDRLLAETSDPSARRDLLASMIDDLYATVLRQAYFVLFEIEAHDAILKGCGAEDLNQLYRRNLEEQFGDSMEISDEFAREWQAIPHIYSTPFYCYAYSFGQLLVLALYQRFLEQGEEFKPGYLRLLSHGGSMRPAEMLAEIGIDAESKEFWLGGVRLIDERVRQLEELG